MNFGTLIAAAIAVSLATTVAIGQGKTDPELEICERAHSDAYKKDDAIAPGIAACTRVLERGNLSSKNQSIIFAIRGYWKHRAKDLEGARADYTRALEINPSNFEAFDYRADLWVELGNDERALADYEQAIRLDPAYAAAYYSRGLIFERRGEIENARDAYRQSLAAPPRDRIATWAHDNARKRLDALDGKR